MNFSLLLKELREAISFRIITKLVPEITTFIFYRPWAVEIFTPNKM